MAGAFAPGPEEKKALGAAPRASGVIDLTTARNESRSDRQRRTNPFGAVREVPVAFMPEVSEQNIQSGSSSSTPRAASDTRSWARGRRAPSSSRPPTGITSSAWRPSATTRRTGGGNGTPSGRILSFPGLAAISDLLILQGGGEVPTSLDEALPSALPAVRIDAGDAFKVAWELYGLRVGESARVRIGANPARTGLGRRLGEFLRLWNPTSPSS